MLPGLTSAVTAGKRFLVELGTVFGANQQQNAPGDEIILPLPPLKLEPTRFTRAIHGSNVHCIRRAAFDSLYSSECKRIQLLEWTNRHGQIICAVLPLLPQTLACSILIPAIL
jgi:hypothetical protein